MSSCDEDATREAVDVFNSMFYLSKWVAQKRIFRHSRERRQYAGEGMELEFITLPVFVIIFTLAPQMTLRGLAQMPSQVLHVTQLKGVIPSDFYFEGSAVTVDKRNTLALETPSGARVLVALIIPSGWASQFPHKYSGVLSSDEPLSVCGNPLKAGTYAFGLPRSAVVGASDSEFLVYDQAGESIMECVSKRDPDLKGPRPVQVIPRTPNSLRLYLGRYWIEIRPYMHAVPPPSGTVRRTSSVS